MRTLRTVANAPCNSLTISKTSRYLNSSRARSSSASRSSKRSWNKTRVNQSGCKQSSRTLTGTKARLKSRDRRRRERYIEKHAHIHHCKLKSHKVVLVPTKILRETSWGRKLHDWQPPRDFTIFCIFGSLTFSSFSICGRRHSTTLSCS